MFFSPNKMNSRITFILGLSWTCCWTSMRMSSTSTAPSSVRRQRRRWWYFTIVTFLTKQNLADILIFENFLLKFLESLFGIRFPLLLIVIPQVESFFSELSNTIDDFAVPRYSPLKQNICLEDFRNDMDRSLFPFSCEKKKTQRLLSLFQGKEESLQMESDARQQKVCLRWSSSIII